MILILAIKNWIQIILINAHGNQGKENVTTMSLISQIFKKLQ